MPHRRLQIGSNHMQTVSYETIRDTIQSGDLLAWEGRSFYGWFIRAYTRSKYTHVGVAWVHQGRVFVLEAREGAGVTLRALSRANDFVLIPTKTEWTEKVEAFALSRMGLPYSWGDILSIVLKRRLKAPGFICTEYAARIMEQLGFNMDYTSYTPVDVVDKVLNQGDGKMVKVRIPEKLRKTAGG